MTQVEMGRLYKVVGEGPSIGTEKLAIGLMIEFFPSAMSGYLHAQTLNGEHFPVLVPEAEVVNWLEEENLKYRG